MLNKLLTIGTIICLGLSVYIGYGLIPEQFKNEIYKFVNTPTPTPYVFSTLRLWQLINDWELKQGWQPYIESPKLCEITNKRLKEIKTDFSHDGFKKYWNTFSYTDFGENLVENYKTEEQTLYAWLASPTHKKNLTDPFQYACLRCDESKCVMLFANIPNGQVQGITNIQPTTTNNLDPIVNCNIHANCGGGTKQLRNSVCSNSICCEVSGKWYFYEDKDKCKSDQNSEYQMWKNNNQVVAFPTFAPIPTVDLSYHSVVIPTFPPLPTFKSPNVNVNIQFHDNLPAPTVPIGYH